VRGERWLLIETGGGTLSLRLSGRAPALTLAIEAEEIASLGDGPPAWPPPADDEGREWTALTREAALAALAAGAAAGRAPASGLQAAFPSLGPLLAREIAAHPEAAAEWLARLAAPRPTLLVPGPLGSFSDRDLARAPAALAPCPLPGRTAHAAATWAEAGALLLELRTREAAFRGRVDAARARAGRQAKRLAELERRLGADLAREVEAPLLRRRAEALLAAAASVPAGSREAVIEDPYEPGSRVRVELDPALPVAANADRLFERARRLERSRKHVEGRLAETRDARRGAEAELQRALDARNLEDLAARAEPAAAGSAAAETTGPRRFLTSRGLELLVGRNARENHQLTFSVARPEDVWLHARDVPGSHVILRDREGRAGADDLREAAEVAAFHSEARAQVAVDVHVTRRKHVRPAKGAPGRVHIGYSETLRVAPRDPQGRLRRR